MKERTLVINPEEIKGLIREYYEKFEVDRLDNLGKIIL